MKTDAQLEDLAYELFSEVHRRLGHVWTGRGGSRESFNDGASPARKKLWIEVARLLTEKRMWTGCWLDDYAFDLFTKAHTRAGDGYTDTNRAAFDAFEPRLAAWCEIARLLDERIRA